MAPSATSASKTPSTTNSSPTNFPYTLLISTPFPTARLAGIAHRALSVDAELSPLVQRSFSISPGSPNILLTDYRATTNRMLRVAVNGFFESLGVVVSCMRELDAEVVGEEWVGDGVEEVDGLKKVQGLSERGVIGNYTEGAGVRAGG